MISTGHILLFTSILVAGGAAESAVAGPPAVPTAPPYIVLSDNLDEPNGYGFCLDTLSRGETDLMHAHSCKPQLPKGSARDSSGHDVRFSYDAANRRITSYAFEGKCMQVLIAEQTSVFALLPCSDASRQRFFFYEHDQTLRLAESQDQCVVVASESQEAGPWVKRELNLADCDSTVDSLKQWTVVPE